MRDGATGRSRGFGFLTFKDAKCVNVVMVKEHYLDGKIIDPKRAIPRDEQERTSKIFVGGVSQEATEQDFKEYFMQFGRVVDATLMMDKDTGRPRGFGFVTFDSEAAVDACLNVPLEILGKPIEVKKAQPRGNVREDEDRGGRGRFQKHGQDQQQQGNYNQNMGGMQGVQGMGGMNGMSPQVMAQYMARMQQYFMMMQQNMAMGGAGRGMNPAMMNPAMMNPMMMQQMQAMQAAQQQGASGARSQSPQSPAVPNPAMMNPMLMQQMAAMQGGQQQGGRQGSAGSQGYNPYDQQQGYDGGHQNNQSRQRRQGSQQANNFQQQPQQFGGNQTSWEGMYDDVPQPGQHGGGRGGFKGHQNQGGHSGPTPAPPAGAPTGPKNAGRPGANYRGGGRGGRGGYHPYAR
jgi:RNA-binding protein Musashi